MERARLRRRLRPGSGASTERRSAASTPGCAALLLLGLGLCLRVGPAGGAARRTGVKRPGSIVESLFFQGKGTDGWALHGARAGHQAHGVEGPVARESDMAIEAADSGAAVWYFSSPPHFEGDRAAAYNGALQFLLYHKQRPPASNSHPLKLGRLGVDSADVILEAQCGHALFMRAVLDRSRSVPTQYSLDLSEDAGWIDSRTGGAPFRLDMLGVLANLRTVKIRGAFYREPETVHLQDVRLTVAAEGAVSGRDLFPCCSATRAGLMDVCLRNETELTPKGVPFDCQGSFKVPVKISTMYPRFGRRSGGTIVTGTLCTWVSAVTVILSPAAKLG